MGLLGVYMTADAATMKRISLSDSLSDSLIDAVENYEEEASPATCDIGKLWDGLHFLLVGIPAHDADKRPPLSAAVLGSWIYGGRVHVGYSAPKHLIKIMKALDDVDIAALVAGMDVRAFAEADIYPDIWYEEDEERLKVELKEAFLRLREFYREALEQKTGILVSIY